MATIFLAVEEQVTQETLRFSSDHSWNSRYNAMINRNKLTTKSSIISNLSIVFFMILVDFANWTGEGKGVIKSR